MPNEAEKTSLLNNAGYAYNFDRMMYINRKTKKAFSLEFVDDNPEAEIASKIHEPKEDQDWRFYTTLPISQGVERELKRVLQ